MTRIPRVLYAGLAFFLGSCGSLSLNPGRRIETARRELQGASLGDAESLLQKADSWQMDRNAAAVYRLRAGEIAWEQISRNTRPQSYAQAAPALHILARAQEGIAPWFVDDQPSTQTFSYAGVSYRVNVPPPSAKGLFDPHDLRSLKPLKHVKHGLCKRCITEPGAGAAYVARWKVPSPSNLAPFLSSRGYLQPVSSTLSFDEPTATNSHQVSLSFHDSTAEQKVRIGVSTFPLAADFTSPIEDVTADIKETILGVKGVFDPRGQDAELRMLEPYDPNRIPIVFVHGLLSHPRMWRDVYNELRADPALRGRFQFWSFKYPTGWPILYSALRLREELEAIEKTLSPQPPPMILIGHSMGGLISHLQAVESGRAIWDSEFGQDADRAYRRLPADYLTKKMDIFEPTPRVAKLIFICVPHRGSKIASWSVVDMLASLIRLPAFLVSVATDFPRTMAKAKTFNGVARLSEKNPTFAALDHLKITVPFHSIIGDRGKGNSPLSSDGAVEYWSSHLDGAASELIVPDNHGAYNHPQSIAEMRRILLEYLRQTGGR